jgi:hypothetical protein
VISADFGKIFIAQLVLPTPQPEAGRPDKLSVSVLLLPLFFLVN